jgi:uncharacterized protein
MSAVTDNRALSRFELIENGMTAFADYRRHGPRLIISHVEAPPGLRGTGAASRLMEGVLASARQEGLMITPLCSFAAAYVRRHRQHQDLLG